MKIVLVDTNWKKFLPVSYTRPVSHLRCGILKVYEKWEKLLNANSVAVSEEYLNQKFFEEVEGGVLVINSKVLPNKNLIEAIQGLEDKEILTSEGTWLAIRSENGFDREKWKDAKPVVYSGDYSTLENWWDLYKQNGEEIQNDFVRITEGRKSQPLSASNNLIGSSDRLFIEEGAYLEGCTLNTDFGCIYIGKNVEVMEGSNIRGGFSVLDESKI